MKTAQIKVRDFNGTHSTTVVNMGGGASTGQNNEELVDNLMRLGYIRSKAVERVFRVVDRANYILSSHKENAYKDVAWKHGNIHLSAPCIYSEVLETLALEPGLSFLNIGSGTGYLSTMAGLLLNAHGINHGIELHEDTLRYAREKLEEFKQKSVALDEFDFCEPVFIRGNCLNVVPDRQYDRVYCGAACPEYYEGFIKQFVAIGGILVMPTKDHLLRLQKLSDDTWSVQSLLPVSFATLIVPSDEEHNAVHLPECVPRTLQEICRDGIRQCIRRNVWHEHNDLIATGAIIQSSFPSHYRWNYRLHHTIDCRPQRIERDFVIPTLESESDNAPSINKVEDFQPMTALLQPQPNYAINSQSNNEPKINNYTDDHSERYLASERFVQPVEQDQSFGINDSVEIHGVDMTKRQNQQDRTNSNDQGIYENDVRKENQNISVTLERQSEMRINYSYTSMSDQNRMKGKNIQQINPANRGTEVSERSSSKDSSSLTPIDDSSCNAESEKQSTLETMMGFYVDDFHSNSFERNFSQSTGFLNSKDKMETIMKSTHHVDNDAFAAYMTEKIFKLPLPLSLKTYINYNRQL